MKRHSGLSIIVVSTAVIITAVDIMGSGQTSDNQQNGLQNLFDYKQTAPMAETESAKSMQIGRAYYNSLIDTALEKHWAVPVALHYNFAHKAFDDRGCDTSIAQHLFGREFTIGDVYLLSCLADANRIHVQNIGEAPGAADSFITRPAADGLQFGRYATDHYVTLLAPTKIGIDAKKHAISANIGGMYRFAVGNSKRCELVVGATLPIISKVHTMELSLVDGTLIRSPGQVPAGGGPVSDTALEDFYRHFISVEDFFKRAVLAPKGLTFEEVQRKTGVGDMSLFVLCDAAGYSEWLQGMQLGFNFVLPSGSTQDGSHIFEPELGCGAFQFEPFVNMAFNSYSSAFNPTLRLVANVGAKRSTSSLRAPRRIVHPGVQTGEDRFVRDVAGIHAERTSFLGYRVLSFDKFDTQVPFFADQKVCGKIKQGTRFLVSAGNYFYNLFETGFRLGAFYEYQRKKQDSISVDESCGEFNTCLLEERTNERSHSISWNLTYKFENYFELNIGSQHTIAGKNTIRNNDLFISFVAVF